MLAEIRGRSQITIPAEIIKKLGIAAVSYTHLDVYKRQR